jgi:HSP20 family protein
MVETKTLVPTSPEEPAISERTRGSTYFTPRVDIYETDQELILSSDIPGIRPEDVDLRYEQGQLLLHGRIQGRERNGELLHQEYEQGDFYRAFSIHESIDSSKIEAKCKSGVLIVRLPKVAAEQPKQITVQKQ